MNIIGLSAFYHESACCLLQDGRLVAAAAEERFSRLKHDARLPVNAWRFCLRQAGLDVSDIDAAAWYEDPVDKLSRQLWSGHVRVGATQAGLDPRGPELAIRQRLGFEGKVLTFPHHLSHAASAFDYSGFGEAAVMTADGVGEWATTAYAVANEKGYEIFEEVLFPHSLGLLYSTLTAYLGFRVNDGEYKLMGLAPYGEPRFVDQVCQLIGMGDGGQFRLNLPYFAFQQPAFQQPSRRMYSEALPKLFGRSPRQPDEPFESFHQDVARSLQLVVEEILLEKLGWLHRQTGSDNLCLAGGVGLNCVANGRILREGPFRDVFIPPAPGDAGGCLGAAALAHRDLVGERPVCERLPHAFWGPGWSSDEVEHFLTATGIPTQDYRGRSQALVEDVAGQLAEGNAIGFFHGRMEHGPRALGGRSILASPLVPKMRDRLNQAVKRRESFRPFAPSVLVAAAKDHFAAPGERAPFMQHTCRVVSPLDLPAITHVDGSARPQTVDPALQPRFAGLLEAFEKQTGCPMLLNTSFNVAGEPIVCSPVDALTCFVRSGLDVLVLEDFVVQRDALPAVWEKLLPAWTEKRSSAFRTGACRSGLDDNLYTFV